MKGYVVVNTAIVLVLLSFTQIAAAQDNAKAVKSAIDESMGTLASGGAVKIVKAETLLLDPKAALESLAAFAASDSPKVRHFACNYSQRIGTTTKDASLRKQVVRLLVGAMDDPSALVWQHASKDLLQYKSDDFSEDTIALITERVVSGTARREDYRLVGVAQITSLIPLLGAALVNETTVEEEGYIGRWYGTAGWAARLARARMGVSEDIARCSALVQAEPNEVTRVGVLLHDLGYIKQNATLKVLAGYIASSAHLPPVEPIFDVGMAHAQYAMDVVAGSFDGCPVKKRYVGGYSDEEIAEVLAWIAGSTN